MMSLGALKSSLPLADLPSTDARLGLVPQRGGAGLDGDIFAAGRLDFAPQHVLVPVRRIGFFDNAVSIGMAVAIHGAFAAGFVFLLHQRPDQAPHEIVTPVEFLQQPAEAPKPVLPKPPPEQKTQPQAQAKADDTADSPPPPPEAAPPPSAKLVAAPPEPMQAATQSKQNKPANIVPDEKKPEPPVMRPQAPAPRVLTAADGSLAVPAPAPAKPDPAPEPKPSAAAPKPDPEAVLEAALPMDTIAMPESFRAMLSGLGSQSSEEYKGVVFGRLGHSLSAVEHARALHLKGQVMVAFDLDDQGHVSDLQVAVSSGAPALDAIALDMVREAAPFPPPPPGTKHEFSPVLSFGDQ